MAQARDTGGVRMVRADRLRPLVRSLFTAVGVPDADAETVAEVLVEADLRGVESHGTTRVAGYVSMIKGGLLNPKPTVEVFRDTPSTAMLEGDRAFGIVVATRAMRLAIGKAARAGVACVTARNVTHTGMVGFYPMLAARAGMIGVAVNNGPAILPPFGGRTPTVATNPFSVAVPAGAERPIVLDMATSIVAGGKLRLAAKKGLPIPEGWALDRNGAPTTDPGEAIFHGFIQWAGGYKGFGLATVVIPSSRARSSWRSTSRRLCRSPSSARGSIASSATSSLRRRPPGSRSCSSRGSSSSAARPSARETASP